MGNEKGKYLNEETADELGEYFLQVRYELENMGEWSIAVYNPSTIISGFIAGRMPKETAESLIFSRRKKRTGLQKWLWGE